MSIGDIAQRCSLAGEPAAILWDMDGTLVDSEGEWARATGEVVSRHGGSWLAQDVEFALGASQEAHANRMVDALARDGITADPGALFAEVVDTVAEHFHTDLEFMPGARELLEGFRAAGIPQVLVSASPQRLVDIFVASCPEGTFAATVTGDDQVPSKPDPAPYRLGAQKVGVEPERCLAFEDSPHGIQSATICGATTVDVNRISLRELAELL
ncbi:MAG: HAD family hydrolase [Flaviflexus sp.]|nr:HAD family hydrolase [Flaviflexus sp.]